MRRKIALHALFERGCTYGSLTIPLLCSGRFGAWFEGDIYEADDRLLRAPGAIDGAERLRRRRRCRLDADTQPLADTYAEPLPDTDAHARACTAPRDHRAGTHTNAKPYAYANTDPERELQHS